MSIHTVAKRKGIYFITFTCHNWLPLIHLSDGYNCVYRFFDVLTKRGNSITGFVIMPNHIHLLLYYAAKEKNINTLIGNGKRFMAYDMLQGLQDKNQTRILKLLEAGLLPKDVRKGQKHFFWKETFDIKECRTEKFLLQKLNYIHNNPVSGRWKLADSPPAYLHSSAAFYARGRQGLFDVRDYREFLGEDGYADGAERW